MSISSHDKLVLSLDFSQFEYGIKEGYVVKKEMKPQVPIGGLKEVESVIGTTKGATTATLVTSLFTQTIMNGCLAQVWGMINGL